MPASNRADYFDIHDEEGQPLAGLLVLLDKRGQPARAELHVAADTERAAARTAVQQARGLLVERYRLPARPAQADVADGGNVDAAAGDPLPLYVLRVDQQSVVDVDLPAAPARRTALTGAATYGAASSDEPITREFSLPDAGTLLPYATAAAVGLSLVLLVWAAAVFLDRSDPEPPVARGNVVSGEAAGETADEGVDDALVESAAGEQVEPGGETASDVLSDIESDTESDTEPVAEPTPASAQEAAEAALGSVADPVAGAETNGLPPSENADPSLAVGDRARMVGTAYLMPEPRAEPVEDNVGALTDGEVVTLVGGPVWREGTTDTIVWWLVELESGEQAWVVANTSQLTLLRPVE